MLKVKWDASDGPKVHVNILFVISGALSGAMETPKTYGNLIIDILVDFPEKINPKHQDILKALVPKCEPDLVDSTGTISKTVFEKIHINFRSQYDAGPSSSRESQKHWRRQIS